MLAFLVTGALIAGSVEAWNQEVYGVAGVVSVAALSFYLGNIYGAINSAHLTNQERLESHIRDYATSYEWWEEAEWGSGMGDQGAGFGRRTGRGTEPW